MRIDINSIFILSDASLSLERKTLTCEQEYISEMTSDATPSSENVNLLTFWCLRMLVTVHKKITAVAYHCHAIVFARADEVNGKKIFSSDKKQEEPPDASRRN